ncbi:hypothetical protein JQ554_33135 [Bradyrhizobium diazoefficiens]|nr:hypothetical protein [Bradyrhizobium diazoefficiens]UCF55109.1 MAG: hypothetical protein JSV48_13660 [Bradyrhizobium sp.]MBR0968889.1 hypothetical protein [Bradyrhizobium diazoefficiens]MBR0982232.1 hypothetical protein [Bradyrhizobium diazoefficiens]MBR1011667.1 hypothetical protein [Bradyrhizobium diazoefficiens]MBR1018155.1 hypothetical protein [Bradyrhizobium diazoefficiens]
MNREQAKKIHKHLLDAAAAFRRAEAAIVDVGDDGRKLFAEPLVTAVFHLRFKLLRLIYNQFPDLEPPGPPATIDSTLRWEDVSLPPSVLETDLYRVIFSVMKSRWQKVAMVLYRAVERVEKEEALAAPVDFEAFAARIQALVEADLLEAQGNLQIWGHSEVRLKDRSVN